MTPDQPGGGFGAPTPSDPAAPVNFANTRPQVGPVATGGPGTIGQQAGAAWSVSGQSGIVSAAKFGYRFGRDAAQAQGSQTQPAAAEGSGWPSNGDGGSEPASQQSLDELHSKVEDLQGSVSGMGSSAAAPVQNANLQHLTPSWMPPAEPSVSPLQASAQARDAAHASMAQGQQNLQAGQQRTVANFQARQQASSAGMRPAATTNAMSQGYADRSFFGSQGSGNGTADSTWQSSRWQR